MQIQLPCEDNSSYSSRHSPRPLPPQHPHRRRRPLFAPLLSRLPAPALLVLLSAGALFSVRTASATPQFARQTGSSCIACHSVPPKLNQRGEAFVARGYRTKADVFRDSPDDASKRALIAAWLTGRHEEQRSRGFGKTYLPKVELISGGPIAESFSYFVEWRVVSLSARSDGTLQDRSGRFEDAFINWEVMPRHELRLGQFRAVQQYDVSLRLSISEPSLFSASLPGKPSGNSRRQGLRAFSPAGRSPGLAYSYHSITGKSPADGLFHTVTLPFPGEFSLPLTREARREASFELEGRPKGVFLETFYRRGLNSVGIHSFLDEERWLATGLGRLNYHDFYAVAGLGMDGGKGISSRNRYSLELEYLPSWFDRIRPGAGFRVEYVSGNKPAYIPYLVLSGPNTSFTFLAQLEYRIQENAEALVLDFSFLF